MRLHQRSTTVLLSPALLLWLAAGCSDVVTEGRVSDRETGSTIPDVEILRSTGDGQWKRIERTDSVGAYFVFKSQVKGGGHIKLTKPGYYPEAMTDSEFLGSSSHVMIPTGRTPDDMDRAAERMGE